jgi:Pectate lyase superfamily protein
MSLPALHYLSQNRRGNDLKRAAVILLASMIQVPLLHAQSGSGCGQSEATNVKTCFQAKGDLRSADRCSMTSGSGSLRCSGGPFAEGDVGKSVYVQSAGNSGRSLASTIVSYVSASEVDVTPVATSTVSNVSSVWGTDDTSALQSAYKAVVAKGGALYIPPGNYLHHGLNWTGNNIKIYGDGYGGAQLTALAVTNPDAVNRHAQTVGVDLSGSGYNQVSNLVFFGGLQKFPDLAPTVNILAGRSGSSGNDFAIAHIFESDFFVTFGGYNVVLYAYEQSDFHNNHFESSGSVNNGSLYLSAANSPGFISPYVNLVAPVSSMTKVNVSGGRTSFAGAGKLIVLDQGASGSNYNISIRDAFALLWAPGSIFLSDTGSASGYGLRHIVLDEVNIETIADCRDCRAVNINAPAWNWEIRNVQFYGPTGMTVSPYTFHGGFLDGSVMIDSTGPAKGYANPEFNASSCAGSILHLGEQQPTTNCTDYGYLGSVRGGNPGMWTHGTSVPNGRCTNGSLHSNTSGSRGSTLYVCVEGSWVDIR